MSARDVSAARGDGTACAQSEHMKLHLFLSTLVASVLLLTGCPDDTSSGTGGTGADGGNGGSGGSGGNGGSGGSGGQADGGGGSSQQTDLDRSIEESCEAQCCGCTEQELADCPDFIKEKNAPEDPMCNDEFVVFLDCMTANWDCAKDPMEILVVSCSNEYGLFNDCEDLTAP